MYPEQLIHSPFYNTIQQLIFQSLYYSEIKLQILIEIISNIKKSYSSIMYSGIYNSGGTCYMNSLLQILFHTQSFRQRIFSIDISKQENYQNSIPIQLALFFAQLAQKTGQTLSTQFLTKSFKWTKSQLYQQHDSSEFLHLLLQSLKVSLNQPDFMDNAFTIKQQEYIKCKNCLNENAIQSQSYELVLPVKDFINYKYHNNLMSGLQQLLQQQNLYGDNKYYCQNCKCKQDALKGMKLKELPNNLIISLNRFTYDIFKDQRVKLSHYVFFPTILYLYPFVNKQNFKQYVIQDLPQIITQQTQVLLSNQSQQNDPSRFLQIMASAAGCIPTTQPQQKLKSYNPLIKYDKKQLGYQLYGVLVHAGGAHGGHYYSIIKDYRGVWIEYDDSSVSVIDQRRLMHFFGNVHSQKPTGVTAYNLFYRKIGAALIQPKIPQHLYNLLKQIKQKEQFQKIKKQNSVTICVFKGQDRLKLVMDKSCKIFQIQQKAFQYYKITNDGNSRIRLYQPFQNLMLDSYKKGCDKSLKQLDLKDFISMTIESKKQQQQFIDYDPQCFQLKICLFNKQIKYMDEQNLKPKKIFLNKKGKLLDLVSKVQQITKQKACLYKIQGKIIIQLQNYQKSLLFDLKLYNSCLVLVQSQKQKGNWSSKIQALKYISKWNVHYMSNVFIVYGSTKQPIQKIKQQISLIINIPSYEFIMYPQSIIQPQLTDIKDRQASTINRFNNIIVKQGIPIDQQIININMYIGQRQQRNIKKQLYKKIEIKNKSLVCQLKLLCGFGSQYRLRVLQNDWLYQVLRQTQPLKCYKCQFLLAQKCIIQQPRLTQILLYTWDKSTMNQISIDMQSPYQQIMQILQEYTQIPPQELQIGLNQQDIQFIRLKNRKGKLSDLKARQGNIIFLRRNKRQQRRKYNEPILKIG